MPDLLVNVIVHFGAQLVLGLFGIAAESAAADGPSREPVVVHEVRTTSHEEIAAAGAEVEEVLARARAAEEDARRP